MALPTRPRFFRRPNGERAALPFSNAEYDRRIEALRHLMAERDIPAVLFTSMQNIAYYSGFLYCSFGRPYGCVVTSSACTVISANIDGGQPWRRSHCENLIYTDWQRNNFWRAVASLIEDPGRIGIEFDHMTLAQREALNGLLGEIECVDIAAPVMAQRMVKSAEEIGLIREGARIADIGGAAIRDAIGEGEREIDIAMAERDLLQFRSFGYGLLSHYYGREAGLEFREDIDTILEPGMVVSMEPMLWPPEGMPGAGGYREHDILVVTESGADNITGFPYGPEHNIVG